MPKDMSNALAVFKKIRDNSWSEIKEKYLYPELSENECRRETIITDGDSIEVTFAFVDIFDYYNSHAAIKAIFPEPSFNISENIHSDIEKRDNESRFRILAYEFIVSGLEDERSSIPVCTVKISPFVDHSSSVNVNLRCDSIKLQKLLKNTKNIEAGIDYRSRIINAFISQFYLLSERELGITSESHRHSNIYIDLIGNENEIDEQEYPKFNVSSKINPMIGNSQLFKADEIVTEFAIYKQQKHVLEMAASFFPLRLAMNVAKLHEWTAFKESINMQIENVKKHFLDDHSPGDDANAKHYVEVCMIDLEDIYKQIEDWISIYEKNLTVKKQEIIRSDYTQKSLLAQELKRAKEEKGDVEKLVKLQERDMEIAALNRLYLEYLCEMTKINEQILELQQSNQKLIDEIKGLSEELIQDQKLLEYLNKEKELCKKVIPLIEDSRLRNDLKRKDITSSLRKNIIMVAKLQIEKLRNRYLAHLFINNNYICRSAMYHVVNTMYHKKDISISEQTLLGSMLHQIGLKLLYTRKLANIYEKSTDMPSRSRKYSQNIHHLLFFAKEITGLQISNAFKKIGPNKLGILSRLKCSSFTENGFRLFSEEELVLLNNDVITISKTGIESKGSAEDKKMDVKKSLEAEKCYLSIAAKITAAVYISRIKRKQGALWGRINKSTTIIPQQTESKTEKELESKEKGMRGALLLLQQAQFKKDLKASVTDERGQLAMGDLSGATVGGDAECAVTSSNTTDPLRTFETKEAGEVTDPEKPESKNEPRTSASIHASSSSAGRDQVFISKVFNISFTNKVKMR